MLIKFLDYLFIDNRKMINDKKKLQDTLKTESKNRPNISI